MTKILVIEDETHIRNNICELLEAEDFNVLNAPNGKIGIQLAKEHLPDLIICDVIMPEVDGYGVLRYLRQNILTAGIPFIFLTSLTDRINLRQGMELGADDYLTKPCTADELIKAIVARLSKHSATKQYYEKLLRGESNQSDESLSRDTLTNLPSRLSLRQQFDQILQSHPNLVSPVFNQNFYEKEEIIPILCLGLDRFNRINDTLGYDVGDALLKTIAEKLGVLIANKGVLAHLNADQFVVIGQPLGSKKEATKLAQAVLTEVSKPEMIGSQEVFITASIGVAFYPYDSRELDQLLRYAKRAMDWAKQEGGNKIEVYTDNFNSIASDQLDLEKDLRYALDRAQLQVYYQPQVNLKTGEITGVEALLRWFHPTRGMISPAHFIPLAEETGLIEPIGEWVLQIACQQVKTWRSNLSKNLRVAVNLSSRQFHQIDLRQRLVKILLDVGLDPHYLELELAESTLVKDVPVAIHKMNSLKAAGIRIAIDDFGTGYSSLSYLQQFPFDVLKIDQCFVRNIHQNPKNAAITNAIISMSHQMQLTVIAEGVETETELDILAGYNCDEIQGYFFSRPISSTQMEELLARGQNFPVLTDNYSLVN